MPDAKTTFDSAITDAEELLAHFDSIDKGKKPQTSDVLKRAGLIMALTAWETYVEDRAREAVRARLGEGNKSFQNEFVLRHLDNTLKSFHNPDSAKTRKLFADFLAVDVTQGWRWNNYEPDRVVVDLDLLIAKRGEAVHRSRPVDAGNAASHLVKRDELAKCIRFLKDLVNATQKCTSAKTNV